MSYLPPWKIKKKTDRTNDWFVSENTIIERENYKQMNLYVVYK